MKSFKNLSKRALALFMALMMSLSLVQVTALAAEREALRKVDFVGTKQTGETGSVRIGDSSYPARFVGKTSNDEVIAYLVPNDYGYDMIIAGEGGVKAPLNCGSMYKEKNEFTGLTEVDMTHLLNTEAVKYMYNMFRGCSSLKTLKLPKDFDTSNVTDMKYMFYDCGQLTSLDVSNFDTSNVKDMERMFSGYGQLASLDVSNFKTSNVTDMSWMFSGCRGLTSLDVSGFDTSNVTNMQGMFSSCWGLSSLDVSNFNTSKVTDMAWMFRSCGSLKSIKFTTLDGSGFGTSNVKNMSGMFDGCGALDSLDVSSFNTSKVTDMNFMFSGCKKLISLDLSNFDTSRVTGMREMFRECKQLTDLNVSSFNTSNVTDMRQMFERCTSLTSVDMSKFNTSKVGSMQRMFDNCSSLEKLTFPESFKPDKATDMSYMFANCNTLTDLTLPETFGLGYRPNIEGMFSGCKSLTSLDLHGFDTNKVKNMRRMFEDCTSLETLIFTDEKGDGNFYLTSDVYSEGGYRRSPFYGCTALTTVEGIRLHKTYPSNLNLEYLFLDYPAWSASPSSRRRAGRPWSSAAFPGCSRIAPSWPTWTCTAGICPI